MTVGQNEYLQNKSESLCKLQQLFKYVKLKMGMSWFYLMITFLTDHFQPSGLSLFQILKWNYSIELQKSGKIRYCCR